MLGLVITSVDLSKFAAIEFEWDSGNLTEIENHRVSDWECEECFFNDHEVYRNKRKQRQYPTYRLVSSTDAGRKLNVIFFVRERQRRGAGRTTRPRTGHHGLALGVEAHAWAFEKDCHTPSR